MVIKDNNHLFELIECLRGSVLVPRPRGRPLQYVLQKEKQIHSPIHLQDSAESQRYSGGTPLERRAAAANCFAGPKITTFIAFS